MAAGVGFDVPGRLLPQNLAVSFTTAAGYPGSAAKVRNSAASRCLPISIGKRRDPHAQGLQPRPALLRHQSVEENCFVLRAIRTPGRAAVSISSPTRESLVSNWCGAAIVAKAWFAFN